MENVTIRQAAASDIPQLNELFRNDLGYKECSLQVVENQFAGLDHSREAVFVAECDGRIAGVIHVEKYNVLYFPPMANLLALAVASDFRRHGIGSELLTQAETWARQNGITCMRLNSGSSRTQAHEFYRAKGYVDDKTQRRFIKEL
jgi:GNAT superfamily N-acetyltransferase